LRSNNLVGTVTHIKQSNSFDYRPCCHLGYDIDQVNSVPIRQEPAMQWLFLSIAIISEVIATSALKSSNGFTQLWPSLVVVAGYAVAFFFLSLTLRTIPVGIAYAIWSGAGILLVALIAWLVFGQTLDGPAMLGLALIIAGVIVLNVFSGSVTH
jgi:small multidrug resistance pump